jgi:hypothetical protein
MASLYTSLVHYPPAAVQEPLLEKREKGRTRQKTRKDGAPGIGHLVKGERLQSQGLALNYPFGGPLPPCLYSENL